MNITTEQAHTTMNMKSFDSYRIYQEPESYAAYLAGIASYRSWKARKYASEKAHLYLWHDDLVHILGLIRKNCM